jgi:nitrogen fixation/metabolism regulation signal transduction histidine kinase
MMELRQTVLETAAEAALHKRADRKLPARLAGLFAGLRAKLILPYVLLTVLIAMAGVFVITRLVTSRFQERFFNQLLEASRVAADGIVRQERSHLEDLRLMAFTQGVPEAMAARDVEALKQMLLPLAVNNDIEAVTAVDLNGIEMLTLAKNPVTNDYITSQDNDFSNFAIVMQVIASTQDTLGDKYAGLMVTSLGPYLFSSAPVRDSAGNLTGVLMSGTALATLLSDMKAQSLADVIVLDQGGKLVATSMVEPDEGYSPLEIDPDALSDASPSTTLDFEMYGRDYRATYSPLVVRQTRMGILGVALPSNFIVTTLATSRNTVSLIFAATTVATIVIGYLLAQSIARPILKLRSVSQAVAAGDLNQNTGLEMGDEIGELATAFDVMTLKLRERTAEAARLYDETLERNKELAEINARLQTTQAQLIQ